MIRASGQSGTVYVGTQPAARFGRWSAVFTQDAFATLRATITGTYVEPDPFWLTQRPFSLVLQIGPNDWRWDRVAIILTGRDITIAAVHSPTISRRNGGTP